MCHLNSSQSPHQADTAILADAASTRPGRGLGATGQDSGEQLVPIYEALPAPGQCPVTAAVASFTHSTAAKLMTSGRGERWEHRGSRSLPTRLLSE